MYPLDVSVNMGSLYYFLFVFPFSKHTPCSKRGLLSIKEGAFKVEDYFLCSLSFAFLLKISLLNPWPNQQ